MPRRRRFSRKPRPSFFVACEGGSEQGYAALIQRFAENQEILIHLDIKKCKGGDPLRIVQTAVEILQRKRKSLGHYSGQVILLDSDRRGDSPERTNQADHLISKHNFCAVWSKPAFEALVLKHLPGCEGLNPQTADQSYRTLQKHWPEYRKGMTAAELGRQLDLVAVERAAAVEQNLREFLIMIGLIESPQLRSPEK